MMKFNKVLIANRGEIAVRIIRALRSMGISSVAVFAVNDAAALHVKMADETYRLKGHSLKDTYLNPQALIQAALSSGAQAIHPGYGFLSESAGFARAVEEAGLVFIGPSSESIDLMGNKTRARRKVSSLGIPVIEGVEGDHNTLLKEAARLGFPLLAKAASGGGGKGMRIVRSMDELADILETTSREARNYFGDGEVYLERYLESPKHIEVQIMADHHGNTVALFERECSLQRRYQKIIEEAPSPSVDAPLRKRMMEASCKIAAEMGYVNAGTIEYLLSGEDFYFLEMNTRIQVEHPVTELITGVDLVCEQLRIAMGETLGFSAESLSIRGHAIQARVYAENPYRDFSPSPGRVVYYQEPQGEGIRIDSAMYQGISISNDYDPMIAKLIAYGRNREEARTRLLGALSRYAIHGIQSNIFFLVQLLETDHFIRGQVHTSFVGEFMKNEFDRDPGHPADALLTAAFLFASQRLHGECALPESNRKHTIWQEMGYWRMAMSPELLINERLVKCDVSPGTHREFYLARNSHHVKCRLVSREPHSMNLQFDGRNMKLIYTVCDDQVVWVQHGARLYSIKQARRLEDREMIGIGHQIAQQGEMLVRAPMHGRILSVDVKEKQEVKRGDTLMIIESMKMENKILAPAPARVEKISARPGDNVADNAILVYLSNIV